MVFEGKVKNQEGVECDVKTLVDNASLVLVYFSAEWCPPCKAFTPKLKEFYNLVKSEGVVILFSSCDRTEKDMNDYFHGHHGTYHCIPFDSPLKETLQDNCQVQGIPSLCVVDKDGKRKYQGARSDVENSYKDAAAAKQAVATLKAKLN